MAVLTLPVVIVATEEALRAVPRELREASLALGATKFQTVFNVVVPQASPGILTGTILAVSRGAGEVAPILFTGAAYFLPLLAQEPVVAVHVAELPRLRALDAVARRRRHQADPLRDGAGAPGPDLHAQHRGRRRARPDAPPQRVKSHDHRHQRKARAHPEAGRPRPDRLLRREEGGRPGGARHRRPARHGAHRPVGLRQVDLPAVAEPDERAHPRLPGRGRGQAGRRSDLRPGHRPGGGPAAHRDGVPALEPVPEVDQRERRLRPAHRRHQATTATSPAGSSGRSRRPRSGRRSRTASTKAPWASPAASSSGSASRARWPSSRRCC